jgi:hypothetical protein
MNYIALINQFWQLRREVTFSSTEADLYFYLLDISNGRNWKNPFQQSNTLICATIGVSEKPLITARNRLKQHGLIDFTPGVKRSPSTYKLLLLENTLENLHPYRGECDSKSGSESGSECDSLSGENPPDINKHKLKEEGSTASAASRTSDLEADSVAEPTSVKPISTTKPPRSKKKPTATADEVAALPLPHPGETFAKRWATFRAGPKQAKKPLSALELMLTKLGNKPEGFAIVMLEMAIQGDWSGIENGGTAKAFEEWQAAQTRQPTPAPTSPPFDPNALFGYAQSATDGLAQARNSPEYQQFLAEQADEQPADLAALQSAA